MKPIFRQLTLVACTVALILSAPSCDSSNGVMGPAPDDLGFNGTFTGNIAGTQDGQPFGDTLTAILTVNSPLAGEFTTVNGLSGVLTGDASGNTATFSATTTTTKGPRCDGTLSGDMTLSRGSISITAAGQDCDGPLDLTGDLAQTPEIICDDEIDNDADGLTDCDDPDCDCNCSFLDGTTWAITQMDPEVSMYVLQVEIMGDQAIITQTEDGCGEPPGMVTLDETCTFVHALTEMGPHNATCNFVNDEETTGMFTETSFSASFSETTIFTGSNCPRDVDYSGTAEGVPCDPAVCWPC